MMHTKLLYRACFVFLLALLALSGAVANAQTERPDVILTWGHVDDPPVVSFDMERAAAECGAAQDADFAKINTMPITAKTYTDADRAPGRYCYRVFAVAGGLVSQPSNRSAADVPPAAPTDLTGTLDFAFKVSPDGTLTARLRYKQKRPE